MTFIVFIVIDLAKDILLISLQMVHFIEVYGDFMFINFDLAPGCNYIHVLACASFVDFFDRTSNLFYYLELSEIIMLMTFPCTHYASNKI